MAGVETVTFFWAIHSSGQPSMLVSRNGLDESPRLREMVFSCSFCICLILSPILSHSLIVNGKSVGIIWLFAEICNTFKCFSSFNQHDFRTKNTSEYSEMFVSMTKKCVAICRCRKWAFSFFHLDTRKKVKVFWNLRVFLRKSSLREDIFFRYCILMRHVILS